jgi:MFS family permease
MTAPATPMPDKRLALIIPTAFLASLGIGIVNLGMIFLIKVDFGARPALVGLFTALWAGAYLVGCLAFRPLSYRIDAPTSAILMCFLTAALLAAQLAFRSLAAAFVVSTLYGLSCALLWPRLMGWLASGLEGRELSRASGSYNLAWSAGMTVSPFIAGFLSERGRGLGLGGELPVIAGTCLFAATGAFILSARRLAPAPRPTALAPVASATDAAARPAAEDHSTHLRYPAWIGLFAVYVLFSILGNIFPLYAKDELRASESLIGLLLLLRSAAMAAGFWIFGRLRFWQFKPLFLPLCSAATAALGLAFVFARSPAAFALGLALGGILQSFVYSLSVFYGASGSRDRDKRMSVHESVLTGGQIVGSICGGAAYQAISWPVVFVFSSLLALLCFPAQVVLSRKR